MERQTLNANQPIRGDGAGEQRQISTVTRKGRYVLILAARSDDGR